MQRAGEEVPGQVRHFAHLQRLAAVACLLSVGLTAAAPIGQAQSVAQHAFELAVDRGRLVSGPKLIRVKRGDAVELRWRAETPTTVHLHGYDIEVKITPGQAAFMRFQATATGRFPVEVHAPSGRHVTLLYIEVHPR